MTAETALSMEHPSGKGAEDENFPVGSFLIAKALRPHVAVFYAFARAIDDVADNADLPSEEKIRRLTGFGEALDAKTAGPGYEKAERLGESLRSLKVTTRHGHDLISAFVQDSVKSRYNDWAELMDYCDRSASPVGRYLLDIHGEDKSGYGASDALCNALQVINHLQDCGDDVQELDRIYLPQNWMATEGAADDDLKRKALTPGLRRVLDRCLDGCDGLMAQARTLPRQLKSRRLAMESAVIISIADMLIKRLRRQDPLARRVALSKPETLWAGIRGLWLYR